MKTLYKFFVAFFIIGGWLTGFVISVKFTDYPGEPWFIYYLLASLTVAISLKYALDEDSK